MKYKMKYIFLDGIEKSCSQIILGTSTFSTKDLKRAYGLLDTFFENGGNTLDTAHLYGQGESERTIGLWLKERRLRDQIVIIDKGGHHYVDEAGRHYPDQRCITPETITQDLMESLDRLQVDFIDLYLLHRDNPSVPAAEFIDVLHEHKMSGYIQMYGASNWTIKRLEEANRYAVQKGYAGFIANSLCLSLAKPNEPRWPGSIHADFAILNWHKEHQFPLLSWSAQAEGFFTGKFSPLKKSNKEMVRVYYNEENWERLNRAKMLARQLDEELAVSITANHVALAYVLNQPFPVCAIIGPQNTNELNSSLLSLEITLSEEQLRWLDLRKEF